jgi:hypothetical protein
MQLLKIGRSAARIILVALALNAGVALAQPPANGARPANALRLHEIAEL